MHAPLIRLIDGAARELIVGRTPMTVTLGVNSQHPITLNIMFTNASTYFSVFVPETTSYMQCNGGMFDTVLGTETLK